MLLRLPPDLLRWWANKFWDWNTRLALAATCKHLQRVVACDEERRRRVAYWVRHLDSFLQVSIRFDDVWHRPRGMKRYWPSFVLWKLERLRIKHSLWWNYMRGRRNAQFEMPLTEETVDFLEHLLTRSDDLAFHPLCCKCLSAATSCRPMRRLVYLDGPRISSSTDTATSGT